MAAPIKMLNENGIPSVQPDSGSQSQLTGSGGFVKRLAAIDRRTRDKAFHTLTEWLRFRDGITENDLKKLWKSLFYCLWHSDKLPVQTELATSMAAILPSLNPELSRRFLRVFLFTLRREWAGIDRLRMDKFYILTRKFLSAVFTLLSRNDWEAEVVSAYMQVFQEGTLLAQDKFSALGVNLHIADIFLEELTKKHSLDQPGTSMLLDIFCETLAKSPEKLLLTRIQQSVFEKVISLTMDALVREERDKDKAGLSGLCLEDVEKLRKRIFELAGGEDVASPNRKALYAVHSQLKILVKALASKIQQLPNKNINGKTVKLNDKEGKEIMEHKDKDLEGSGKGDLKAQNKNKNKRQQVKDLKKAAVAGRQELEEESNKVVESKEGNQLEESEHMEGTSGEELSEAPAVAVATELSSEKKSAKKKKKKEQEEEPVVANLESLFKAVKGASPPAAGTRQKRKAAAIVAKSQGKKKNVPQPTVDEVVTVVELGTEASGPSESMAGGLQEAVEEVKIEETATKEKPAKRVRRVKFVLKENLSFAKNGPVPPASLRTPPNAAPRGSALKRGVKPGPINVKKLQKSSTQLNLVGVKSGGIPGPGKGKGLRAKPRVIK